MIARKQNTMEIISAGKLPPNPSNGQSFMVKNSANINDIYLKSCEVLSIYKKMLHSEQNN